MTTGNPLTIGQLKKWCEDNNISDDTPIGIYLGDSERGSVAFGVVGDTKSEYNDDYYVTNLTETTGEQFVYEFLPSGIVECQTVKCMYCGEEFTDYVD